MSWKLGKAGLAEISPMIQPALAPSEKQLLLPVRRVHWRFQAYRGLREGIDGFKVA